MYFKKSFFQNVHIEGSIFLFYNIPYMIHHNIQSLNSGPVFASVWICIKKDKMGMDLMNVVRYYRPISAWSYQEMTET